MMFGRAGFPARNEPRRRRARPHQRRVEGAAHPAGPFAQRRLCAASAWEPFKPTPFQFPQLNADGDPPNTWQLIAAGWGFALLDPASVQADNGAGLTRGIIGLVNKGQPRKPDDWGALRAWAWGAGRGLDYLETDPAVDAKHVGIEGVSRYGKAALVTMAFDQRFAMVLVGSSGKGGATLLRRNFGEAVESLTAGEYYWMAGNFMKYGASEATFGSRTPARSPSTPTSSSLSARRASPSSATACRKRATRSGSTTRAASWPPSTPAASSRCSAPRASMSQATTAPRRCRPSTRACSTASSPGASTTAATPTRPT